MMSDRSVVVAVRIFAIALLITVLLALLFAPQNLIFYDLYYSRSATYDLLYRDLGQSDAVSSLGSVLLSAIYALAIVPLLSWTTFAFWRGTRTQLVVAILCWTVIYGIGPAAKLILGDTSVCFDQKTGSPLKWYVKLPSGEIVISDQGGFDPETGLKKQQVTPEICSAAKSRHFSTATPKQHVAGGVEFAEPAVRIEWQSGRGFDNGPFLVSVRLSGLVIKASLGLFCLSARRSGTLNVNLCNGQRGLDGTPLYIWFAPRSEQHYTIWEFTVPALPAQACVGLAATAAIQSDDISQPGTFCLSPRPDTCVAMQDVKGSIPKTSNRPS